MTGAIFAAFVEQIVGQQAHPETGALVLDQKMLQHANTLNQWGACTVLHLDRPNGASSRPSIRIGTVLTWSNPKEEFDFSNVFHVMFTESAASPAEIMTLFDGERYPCAELHQGTFLTLRAMPIAGIPVQIKFINKTSAWVIINDRSLLSRVQLIVAEQVRNVHSFEVVGPNGDKNGTQLRSPKARARGFIVRTFEDYRAGKFSTDWRQLAVGIFVGCIVPLGLAFSFHLARRSN